MYDNLGAHNTARVEALISSAGHTALQRPTHSPDFAPVECAFSNLEMFLERNDHEITAINLHPYIGMWADTLSAEVMQGYFSHCHYFVPGRTYKPYL